MGGEADAVRSRSLVKRYRVEVAASAASVLSTLTTFPLDSVKTRMQTYQYSGFLDCVRLTYQTEKFRGFFRGVTAPMASITLRFPSQLLVCGHIRCRWRNSRVMYHSDSLSFRVDETERSSVGITGLYTGYRLHLLRDTLGTSLYFMTYESSKQFLTAVGGAGAHSNPLAVLVAGGLCGIVSFALIYPVDSAKSRYQRDALMYPKGGQVEPVKIQFFQRNMYRGLGVSVARSCAVNAVFFSAFELLKKRIKALDDAPPFRG
ncbi:hypothetical protein P8C59_005189 [Phyllachora maydis]|uniref:Mitochondrial carrier protein n=1 Tax=Phyllachora maydis TaxID=1825666 RepID=A0AAD9I3U1_9PEZI|nr:hypothetical protein P8C59_005189 [Phyllachora maydis]